MAAAGCTVTLTKVQHEKRPAHHKNDTESLFENPWPSYIAELQGSFGAGFKMMREMKRAPLPPKEELVPVIKPDWGLENGKLRDASYNKDIKATWLGHACFLVEFPIPEGQKSDRGYRLLYDPVFSHRCSPSQLVGPARYTPPPLTVKDMPEIDAVVISHAHYDHLDVTTIKNLFAAQSKGSIHFFVPLGNKKWFASTIGTSEDHVSEFDWWDSAIMSAPSQSGSQLRITCTPCQHFANRGIWDRNHTLWASWAVEQIPVAHAHEQASHTQIAYDASAICKVWFGGDTAYRGVHKDMTAEEEKTLPHCPAFKEIGEKFKSFDFAMIPIGAYSPRWFMSQIHASPEDAVEIHKDVRSKKSVGMHWATWVLTDEEANEPKRRLEAAVKSTEGMKEDEFTTLPAIGATQRITPSSSSSTS